MNHLTYRDFETYLNQAVPLHYDTGEFIMTLIKCEKLNSQGYCGPGREPFSLTFLGPRQPLLPQRMYRLDFGQLGRLEIFIVPVGRDSSGTKYEAVFT